MGSLVALLTTYPLKTIYTLQAIRAVKQRRGFISREEVAAILRSPARLVLALLHDLDWASLYAGLGPAAVETAISSAVYFYFYSMLRQVRCRAKCCLHLPRPAAWATAAARQAEATEVMLGSAFHATAGITCTPCRRLWRATGAGVQQRGQLPAWPTRTLVCWPAWASRRWQAQATS